MQQNKPNEIIDQLVSSSNVTKPSHFHSLQGTAQKGLLWAFILFFLRKKKKKEEKKTWCQNGAWREWRRLSNLKLSRSNDL